MASVLDRIPPGGRVAVLRLRSLGDCVLTTPALEILRRARPDLEIGVMVEDRFRAVFEGNPDISALMPVKLTALRRFRPQLCLNLHGGSTSVRMTAASGAEFRVGFGHFRNRIVYNLQIPRAQEILGEERPVHTAEHLASAMFWLGAPRCEIPRAKLLAAPAPQGAPFAVIHPLGARPEKIWPAEGFLAVAERLSQDGMEPVFVGAETDDLSAFRHYRCRQGPLAALKSLMAAAAFFVGNDSGPAHMAAAFGLPVVVIFGDSDPKIWGPWRTPGEALVRPRTEDALRAVERLTQVRA